MPPAGNQVAFPEDKKLFELAFEPGVGLQGFADNPAGHDPPARLPPAGCRSHAPTNLRGCGPNARLRNVLTD